jgi:chromate reductase, NAD(P)H dehydrogenase (quinone)
MRILAISGSLRRDSHNTALLRAAADLLPPDVEVVIHDGLRDIPPFDEDMLAFAPAAVQRLREQVSGADAVLVSTPEYNSSIPGQLKNALDWLSRPLADSPLRNKPAAVVGASTGIFGAVWAQAETRKVLGAIGARVLDSELPVPGAHEQFTPDGRLADSEIEQSLSTVLGELVGLARSRPSSRQTPAGDRQGARAYGEAVGAAPDRRASARL